VFGSPPNRLKNLRRCLRGSNAGQRLGFSPTQLDRMQKARGKQLREAEPNHHIAPFDGVDGVDFDRISDRLG
jgi:hypothetical protein